LSAQNGADPKLSRSRIQCEAITVFNSACSEDKSLVSRPFLPESHARNSPKTFAPWANQYSAIATISA